jgi:hypothetical protein
MHTEEQAKELWCPHVRVAEPSFYKRGPATGGSLVGHEPASVNRDAKHKDTNCIGSKCSQWRWCSPISAITTPKYHDIPREENLGYCGLSGKP